MYSHHKLDHEFPGGVETRLSYVVCSTPRSGSSLLCELLCNTELAGAPTEFFDPETRRLFSEAWGVESFDDYLAALLEKKTSPNGVFGLKLHYPQLEDAFASRPLDDCLPNPHFIRVTRDDRQCQAVSLARAVQTEQWAAHQPLRGREPEFDANLIRDVRRQIDQQESGWDRFFERLGRKPFEVAYEDFVDTQEATTLATLRHLGIEPPADLRLPPATLTRQADSINEEWLRRLRR